MTLYKTAVVLAVLNWLAIGAWNYTIAERHWACWAQINGGSIPLGERVFDGFVFVMGPLWSPAVLTRERLECDP